MLLAPFRSSIPEAAANAAATNGESQEATGHSGAVRRAVAGFLMAPLANASLFKLGSACGGPLIDGSEDVSSSSTESHRSPRSRRVSRTRATGPSRQTQSCRGPSQVRSPRRGRALRAHRPSRVVPTRPRPAAARRPSSRLPARGLRGLLIGDERESGWGDDPKITKGECEPDR